jgi:hypothetical protein
VGWFLRTSQRGWFLPENWPLRCSALAGSPVGCTVGGIPLLYWHEEVVRDFGVVFFLITEFYVPTGARLRGTNAREIEAGDAREPACSS